MKPGIAMGIAAPTIVGGLVAFSGYLDDYPLLGGQGARYGVAALALVAYALVRRTEIGRPTRGEVGRAALIALTGMLGFNTFVILAVDQADPATVGTIVGCAPLVLALSTKKPTRRLLAAAGIVVLGAGITEGAGGATALGALLAVGALAGEVSFSLIAVPLIDRRGPLVTSIYATIAAAVIGIAAGLAIDGPANALPVPTGNELAALAYTSLGATTLGFVFWYSAVQQLGTATAGLFLGLIPVSAFAIGALLGNQPIDPLKAAGCALVGAGIVLGLSRSGRARSNRFASLRRRSAPADTAASRLTP